MIGTSLFLTTLTLVQTVPSPVITIYEALHEARVRNPDIKAAQARLKQAHELSKKAWSGYLPQIAAGGSYTHNNIEAKLSMPTQTWMRDVGAAGSTCADLKDPASCPNGPPMDPTRPITIPPDTSNPPGLPSNIVAYPAGFMEFVIQRLDQLAGQITLNQAVIVPALWPAIHNAYVAERMADFSVDNARREILFVVAELYIGAVAAHEAMDVQQELLATAHEHERDAEVRFKAGAAPKLVLLRAQIDRAKAEQDLRRAEYAYASAKSALAAMLDRPVDFDVVSPEMPSLPSETPELHEKAVRLRPDVQASRVALELARKTRDGMAAQYAPSVFFQAVYRAANFKGFTGEYDSWAIGLNVSWNLFDGGLRESTLRENNAKMVEAAANARAAENRAHDELRRAALELESARLNRTTAQEQVRLARENMSMVTVNFKAGVATQVDVADAQAALAGAEMSLVTETLNLHLAGLRLFKASGQFNPT